MALPSVSPSPSDLPADGWEAMRDLRCADARALSQRT
jgi:hypothetical protein